MRDGSVVDRISDRFGFRTIETRNGRFYLNGEPLYLRGALDQDYYPDTICTVPSVAFLEDQFRKAKELGLNCLRCHIKAADPRYYEVADRVGMLIWTELPNGGMATERSRGRKEKLLKGIVDRDCNHPSIIIWTIINENWGVDLVHDADHRDWLKRTFAWLKAYDPTRLVVDNSPLAPSFHVESDIADYHFYAAIPDHRDEWDRSSMNSQPARPGSTRRTGMPSLPDTSRSCARNSATGAYRTQKTSATRGAKNPGGSKPDTIGARASCMRTASRTASPTGAWTGSLAIFGAS